MSGFAIRGWCPDAWHPMAAGDGLLVRVRPRLGRMSRAQVQGLCDAALTYGNGLIDMTSRANLQVRGVTESAWPSLLERLVALELVNADPIAEARRNILVDPQWRAGDDTARIASELMARIGELPDLPAKVGFAIDAGPAPVLLGDAGDFRIERDEHGRLILRADGRDMGAELARGEEADRLIALAHWFVETGGAVAGRMARHRADLPDWAKGRAHPAAPARRIGPGMTPLGAAWGLPFGQVGARSLMTLVATADVRAVRTTPWRIVLTEGAEFTKAEGLLDDESDPLLRVDACPGAPLCPQASVETRDFARRIAPHVQGRLHVSGCAKHCAATRGADFTLTGRDGRYDLSVEGYQRLALERDEVLAHFGAA